MTTWDEMLDAIEPSKNPNAIRNEIFFLIDAQTREPMEILSESSFGSYSYDEKAKRWVPLTKEADGWRLRDLYNRCAAYALDWDNEENFDTNREVIAMNLMSEGNLTEDFLKKTCNLLVDPADSSNWSED